MTIEELQELVSNTTDTIADNLPGVLGEVLMEVKRFSNMIANAHTDLEQLAGDLQSANARISALSELIAQVEDTLGEKCRALHDGVDEINDELESFSESAGESLEHLIEQVEELRNHMASTIDGLIETTNETIQMVVVEPFNRLCVESIERLEHFIAEWTDETIPEKVSDVQNEWLSELKNELDELIDGLVVSLDNFRDELIGKVESSGQNREESNAMREILDQALDPIVCELQRVISLASSVGISIG